MPANSFKDFEFQRGEAIDAVAEELAETVEKFGLPFMEENATLSKIAELIPKYAGWEDAGERLLIAKFLLRRPAEEIDQFVQAHIREGCRKKGYIRRFKTFVERFHKFTLEAEHMEK